MAAPLPITTRLLRKRLSDTRLPEDPTRVVMPPGSERWPEAFRAGPSSGLRPAGVLIPVIERQPSPSVLLTQRSAGLRHHAGQVAFPGGRMEPGDADIAVTALRETREEVGIDPGQISIVGYLEPMPTVTGYAVTAVVGIVSEQAEVVIDPNEVDTAFEVPLAFLMDPRNRRATVREVRGYRVPVVEYRHSGQRIWGATAQMIARLEKIISK